jgi:hypothetical protein
VLWSRIILVTLITDFYRYTEDHYTKRYDFENEERYL